MPGHSIYVASTGDAPDEEPSSDAEDGAKGGVHKTPASSSSSKPADTMRMAGTQSGGQSAAQRAMMMYDIGVTRFETGDIREAYEDLKEASRLDPNNMVIWQKYDEVYRAAAPLLSEEHLKSPKARQRAWESTTSSKSSTRMQKGAAGSSSGNRDNEIPPTFTFHRSQRNAPMGLLPHEEPESEERSKEIERMAARQLQLTRGDDSDLGRDRQHMAHLGFAEASFDLGVTRDRNGLRYEMRSKKVEWPHIWKTFFATLACWVTSWLAVVIHYQIMRKAEDEVPINWWEVGIGVCVVLGVALAVTSCVIRGSTCYLSFSDVIKICCGIIIVVAVLWYKLWQEPADKERERWEKAQKDEVQDPNAGVVYSARQIPFASSAPSRTLDDSPLFRMFDESLDMASAYAQLWNPPS